MHIFPAPVLSRATLKKYTGWFSNKNGFRAIITIDGDALRLGTINYVHGNIVESWILAWSNVPTFSIDGDSKEERALNQEFQAMFRTAPDGHMVSFDIEKGEVTGMGMGGEHYKRIERGECMILKMPLEIKQMIWGYALYNDGEDVSLTQQNGLRITNGHSRTRINRINEVHREFATEATHFELQYNTLKCTSAERLADLIKLDPRRLQLCLRNVVLWTDWGQSPLQMPKTDVLHSILRYAKSNEAMKVDVRLSNWRAEDILAKDLLLFVAYGRGIQEVIRGQKSLMVLVNDLGMLQTWKIGQNASELNAENVKFFPAEEIFDEAAFRLKVSHALAKTTTFRKTLIPYDLWRPTAIEMRVEDVRSWYENGA